MLSGGHLAACCLLQLSCTAAAEASCLQLPCSAAEVTVGWQSHALPLHTYF